MWAEKMKKGLSGKVKMKFRVGPRGGERKIDVHALAVRNGEGGSGGGEGGKTGGGKKKGGGVKGEKGKGGGGKEKRGGGAANTMQASALTQPPPTTSLAPPPPPDYPYDGPVMGGAGGAGALVETMTHPPDLHHGHNTLPHQPYPPLPNHHPGPPPPQGAPGLGAPPPHDYGRHGPPVGYGPLGGFFFLLSSYLTQGRTRNIYPMHACHVYYVTKVLVLLQVRDRRHII
jgi:hypothetical protein